MNFRVMLFLITDVIVLFAQSTYLYVVCSVEYLLCRYVFGPHIFPSLGEDVIYHFCVKLLLVAKYLAETYSETEHINRSCVRLWE
jgi:hypothetical protein